MTRQRRRGARERVVRRDDAALAQIRAQRAANRAWRMPRGVRYRVVTSEGAPVGDDFELWAIRTGRRRDGSIYPHVVFRSIQSPSAFLVFDDAHRPDPRGFYYPHSR